MKKKLIIYGSKSDYADYILNGLTQNDIIIYEPEKIYSIYGIIYKILNRRLLRRIIPYVEAKMIYSYIQKNDIDSLLFFNYVHISVYKYLNKRLFCINKSLWLWNPIERIPNGIELVNQIQNVKIYSFDPADAVKFNLKYLHSVYRYGKKSIVNEIEYSFYYLGHLRKKRSVNIEALEKKLVKAGFLCNFISVESEYLPYKMNIELLKKSSCLVDLVQENQKGLSLRPLEAIFFGKKLITNNKELIHAEFYNPNNILIISNNININEIKRFMNKEYIEIEKRILDKYDINNWIYNFLDI